MRPAHKHLLLVAENAEEGIDAVFNDLKRRGMVWTLAAGKAVHTGTTDATVVASAVVPGGSMGANGFVRITPLYDYPNSANSKTLAISFGGATFFSNAQTTTAIAQGMTIVRNNASESAQVAYYTGTFSTLAAFATAETTAAVDTSADVTINFTVTLGSAAETVTLWYLIEVGYVE